MVRLRLLVSWLDYHSKMGRYVPTQSSYQRSKTYLEHMVLGQPVKANSSMHGAIYTAKKHVQPLREMGYIPKVSTHDPGVNLAELACTNSDHKREPLLFYMGNAQ